MTTKYIFVTGGVTSSLGKGIIAASLAKLLQASTTNNIASSQEPVYDLISETWSVSSYNKIDTNNNSIKFYEYS